MKNKHFYSHLVSIEKITLEFDNLKLSNEEKEHLTALAGSNIHHAILDLVMSHMNTNDKATFLKHMEKDDHDKTWQFILKKVDTIQAQIIKSSEKLIEEFLDDIAKIKKKTK